MKEEQFDSGRQAQPKERGETIKRPLFPLGQVVATPGALNTLQSQSLLPSKFLYRHVIGDWGDLHEEDIQSNHYALVHGTQIFSAYELENKETIYVITEPDRSVTTLLRSDEY